MKLDELRTYKETLKKSKENNYYIVLSWKNGIIWTYDMSDLGLLFSRPIIVKIKNNKTNDNTNEALRMIQKNYKDIIECMTKAGVPYNFISFNLFQHILVEQLFCQQKYDGCEESELMQHMSKKYLPISIWFDKDYTGFFGDDIDRNTTINRPASSFFEKRKGNDNVSKTYIVEVDKFLKGLKDLGVKFMIEDDNKENSPCTELNVDSSNFAEVIVKSDKVGRIKICADFRQLELKDEKKPKGA